MIEVSTAVLTTNSLSPATSLRNSSLRGSLPSLYNTAACIATLRRANVVPLTAVRFATGDDDFVRLNAVLQLLRMKTLKIKMKRFDID